ncbi:AAA family ATPase [Photobacterium damselae]
MPKGSRSFFEQIETVSVNAVEILDNQSSTNQNLREEFGLETYYKRFSREALKNFPHLSKAIAVKACEELEEMGYKFPRQKNKATLYSLRVEDIVKIYEHRGIPKYRDKYNEAFTIFVSNLKGGVSKSVSTTSLAHSLRTSEILIQHDLRILVIDLDPQASSTLFLRQNLSIGDQEYTSAQAMLHDLTREQILEFFCHESMVPNVDVMPASILDAFVAADWEHYAAENFADKNPLNLLRENVIDKIKGDYDFILLDCGPHLDAFLLNALAAADVLLTPIPPAQVDMHSTMKYLSNLPSLYKKIEESGIEVRTKANVGYMTKIQESKADHQFARDLAKEIFGDNLLDTSLARLDGFERSGESFDTVITANPSVYEGSKSALANAKNAASKFATSVFSKVNTIRNNK